jgi:hypothetical protein
LCSCRFLHTRSYTTPFYHISRPEGSKLYLYGWTQRCLANLLSMARTLNDGLKQPRMYKQTVETNHGPWGGQAWAHHGPSWPMGGPSLCPSWPIVAYGGPSLGTSWPMGAQAWAHHGPSWPVYACRLYAFVSQDGAVSARCLWLICARTCHVTVGAARCSSRQLWSQGKQLNSLGGSAIGQPLEGCLSQ